MTDVAAIDAPPPPPPRPITRRARRQAGREVAVRKCMLVTFGVALVVVVVGWRNVADGLADRRLRQNGVRVMARIDDMTGGVNQNVDRGVARTIALSFVMPGETERRTVAGSNSPMPGRFSTGETIPIFFDPYGKRWTDRVESPGWPTLLAVPLLLSPLVALLGAITVRARGRSLRAYREGAFARGTVSDVQTSPLAPGQKVLRVALADRAAVVVTRPDALGGPIARGDAVDVIVDARGHAVLAAAYA